MSETPLTRASEDAADKELAEAFLRLNPELARRVALLGLARQGEKARAEAAEAEVQRLTEGLREIEEVTQDVIADGHVMLPDIFRIQAKARARYVCLDCGTTYAVDVNGVMWERTPEWIEATR